MNMNALFCDGTASYVIPAEPQKNETVVLRFRTAKDDVLNVFLRVGMAEIPMQKKESKGQFDYYEVEWHLETEPFLYIFRIETETECCFYDRCGVTVTPTDEYQFKIVPGFSTPDWAKGAVMYQIFVDRFYNGDPSNDVESGEYIYIKEPTEKVSDWYEYPKEMDVRRFYGGDLQGVMDKLDYLQDLGVEVIYFNPIFVSPSNHKYDIQDYDHIDPHYGKIVKDCNGLPAEEAKDNLKAEKYRMRTGAKENLDASNELFVKLVEEMHKRGMKVILDGVFNHCGSFNKWMDRERLYESQEGYEKGAYVDAESPYRSFFHFTKEEWPYNREYESWWGNDTLPKLNYEDSQKLEQYILDIGKKWLSPPYNIDGWRLDVAADLGRTNEYNHKFWKKFRKVVKETNPDALILAEHYGDPIEWLQGDQWDSVMNYDAFMEPVTWFFTGMEKHSDEFREDMLGNAVAFVNSMRHFMAKMLTPSLEVAMNELSNHDHSRFLTRTNHKEGRIHSLGCRAAEEHVNEAVMKAAVVMQMTWVGAPTLYYGDEAGLCGFTDPDNRRTYPWGRENKGLLEFHREMIHIHKQEKPLKRGSLKMLGWKNQVLAYARFQEEEQIVVLINNGVDEKTIHVPVWEAEVPADAQMTRVIYSYLDGYDIELKKYSVVNGNITVAMKPYSAMVLKSCKDKE
ncbi:MAG: glycoside hydrolase family 13 protein [Schaedlerella sp.]|nr:glycoside hydrolase family 13 protein [Schaedlerella sp.]